MGTSHGAGPAAGSVASGSTCYRQASLGSFDESANMKCSNVAAERCHDGDGIGEVQAKSRLDLLRCAVETAGGALAKGAFGSGGSSARETRSAADRRVT